MSSSARAYRNDTEGSSENNRSMEMNGEEPGAKRQRVSRACDRCHKQGNKCAPSGTLGICQGCVQSKSECTFNRPQKKRGRIPIATPQPVTRPYQHRTGPHALRTQQQQPPQNGGAGGSSSGGGAGVGAGGGGGSSSNSSANQNYSQQARQQQQSLSQSQSQAGSHSNQLHLPKSLSRPSNLQSQQQSQSHSYSSSSLNSRPPPPSGSNASQYPPHSLRLGTPPTSQSQGQGYSGLNGNGHGNGLGNGGSNRLPPPPLPLSSSSFNQHHPGNQPQRSPYDPSPSSSRPSYDPHTHTPPLPLPLPTQLQRHPSETYGGSGSGGGGNGGGAGSGGYSPNAVPSLPYQYQPHTLPLQQPQHQHQHLQISNVQLPSPPLSTSFNQNQNYFPTSISSGYQNQNQNQNGGSSLNVHHNHTTTNGSSPVIASTTPASQGNSHSTPGGGNGNGGIGGSNNTPTTSTHSNNTGYYPPVHGQIPSHTIAAPHIFSSDMTQRIFEVDDSELPPPLVQPPLRPMQLAQLHQHEHGLVSSISRSRDRDRSNSGSGGINAGSSSAIGSGRYDDRNSERTLRPPSHFSFSTRNHGLPELSTANSPPPSSPRRSLGGDGSSRSRGRGLVEGDEVAADEEGDEEALALARKRPSLGMLMTPLDRLIAIRDTVEVDVPHDVILDLLEHFRKIIYPVWPFFHWPSFVRDVITSRYKNDKPFRATVMAVCAIAAGRLKDESDGKSNSTSNPTQHHVDLSSIPSSDDFRMQAEFAISSISSDPVNAAVEFDNLRGISLLALLAIQNSRSWEAQVYFGRFLVLSSMSGFEDESTWEKTCERIGTKLTDEHRQERRCLFWTMYQLESYSSVCWGTSHRIRESQARVGYPNSHLDNSSNSLYQDNHWIEGWNYTSTVFRILEHAMEAIATSKRRHNLALGQQGFPPDLEIPGVTGVGRQIDVSQVLDCVERMHKALPKVFKDPRPMTGNFEHDIYGFQALKVLISTQTAKIFILSFFEVDVTKRSQVASDLIDRLAAVSPDYLTATKGSLTHILASVGNVLGEIVSNPMTLNVYLDTRRIVISFADLLARLEAHLDFRAGTSAKLREHIDRTDVFMQEAAMVRMNERGFGAEQLGEGVAKPEQPDFPPKAPSETFQPPTDSSDYPVGITGGGSGASAPFNYTTNTSTNNNINNINTNTSTNNLSIGTPLQELQDDPVFQQVMKEWDAPLEIPEELLAYWPQSFGGPVV